VCLWGLETFTVFDMSSDIIKVSLADLCGRCVTLLVRLQKWHLFLRFNGHFPAGSGLAGTMQNISILDFIGAKGDGGGGNNWSYKMYKAPVTNNKPSRL